MKIYKSVIGLLVLVLCAGLMYLAKVKFYEPSLKDKKELEEQIELNNRQIEALEEYRNVDKEGAEAAVADLQEKEEEWLGGFHGLYKDEDLIMYVKDTQDDRGTDIFEISLGNSGTIARLGNTYSLSVRELAFDYKTSYEGFKRYVEYLTGKYPQTSIRTLSMEYDKNTKDVKGAFSVILYYVEKGEYESPDAAADHGLQNIFEPEGRLD